MAARWWWLLLIALAAAASLWAFATIASCGTRNGTGLETITIGSEAFHLEVSADDASRQQGLMQRDSIPEDGGMLFIFPSAGMRNFWMANCLVDIDIIYLDAQGRVTAPHRMKAQPPRRSDEPVAAYERRMRLSDYSSRYPAQFAVELKAGALDRLDLNVDDKIALDLPRLKAMAR